MKVKIDYSDNVKSMTVELISETDVERAIIDVLWRDRFEVSSLHSQQDFQTVKFSKRDELNHI